MLLEDVIGTDNFLKAHKVLKEEVNILYPLHVITLHEKLDYGFKQIENWKNYTKT